ncbi:MAG: hypothetical protein QXL51_01410 [Candidatus Aenigmatarchaeota archaeon]
MEDKILKKFTDAEIEKHTVLLQDHIEDFNCPECIAKHLLAIEGYAEEGSLQTDDEKEKLKYLKIAETVRKLRKILSF